MHGRTFVAGHVYGNASDWIALRARMLLICFYLVQSDCLAELPIVKLCERPEAAA